MTTRRPHPPPPPPSPPPPRRRRTTKRSLPPSPALCPLSCDRMAAVHAPRPPPHARAAARALSACTHGRARIERMRAAAAAADRAALRGSTTGPRCAALARRRVALARRPVLAPLRALFCGRSSTACTTTCAPSRYTRHRSACSGRRASSDRRAPTACAACIREHPLLQLDADFLKEMNNMNDRRGRTEPHGRTRPRRPRLPPRGYVGCAARQGGG